MRHRLAVLALVAALGVAAPVQAAGLSGMGAALFGNTFNFGKPNLSKPMVKTITVGSMKMELQHTKLTDIRKAFGGTIQTQGENKTLVSWLCYQTDGSKDPATATWFISNILGGGEFVMIVAVQAANLAKMPGDCEAASPKFAAPNLGIPGVGATLAELKAAFGAARGNKIAYRADEPGADALGTAMNAQYIGYMLSGGKVTGYGAGETSVPAAPPKN
ncbi:MAG: hypothetical protein Q7T08_06765 [Devosia sp.]|nr:hypothetical protein [Devosia sp.]